MLLAVLTVALLLFAALFARRAWREALSVRSTLLISSALLVVAVVAQPNGNDLWYYQMYGRIAEHYQESPYEHAPFEYAGDPLLERTGGAWDGVNAEYGPVFIGAAAGVASLTGTDPLAIRLAWQGLAALAVFLSLVIIARRTRSGAAVALVGMNPIVVYSVVNAGHNDAWVGLLVLGAIVLCADKRDVAAVLLLAVATLIKVPVGLGLAALLLWVAWHRGLRQAIRPALAAATTLSVVLLAAGGSAVLRPMLTARTRINDVSFWNLLRGSATSRFAGDLDPYGVVPDHLPTVAVLAVAVLASALVLRRVRELEPTGAVASALVAWIVLALYTTPWYIGWVLPPLALRRDGRASIVVMALVSLRIFIDHVGSARNRPYEIPPTIYPALGYTSAYLQAAAMLASVVVAAVLVLEPPGGDRPGTVPASDEDAEKASRIGA